MKKKLSLIINKFKNSKMSNNQLQMSSTILNNNNIINTSNTFKNEISPIKSYQYSCFPKNLKSGNIDQKKMNPMNFSTNLVSSILDSTIKLSHYQGEQFEDDPILKEYSIINNKRSILLEDLKIINEKIVKNNDLIERNKKQLDELKSEKKRKQNDIVNLLSNKESIEEIYKNKIYFLINKNIKNEIENLNNNFNSIISISGIANTTTNNITNNTVLNNDEDNFVITINDIKYSDKEKYKEQIIAMIEDIFNSKGINNNNALNDIIEKSYEVFEKEIKLISDYSDNNISINESKNNLNKSNPNFELMVNNFFMKASLYISNQSYGRYSESKINLFLRYLLKINVINKRITKYLKFVNKKYKDEKRILNFQIINSTNKNENLHKKQENYEKLLKEYENKLEFFGKNDEYIIEKKSEKSYDDCTYKEDMLNYNNIINEKKSDGNNCEEKKQKKAEIVNIENKENNEHREIIIEYDDDVDKNEEINYGEEDISSNDKEIENQFHNKYNIVMNNNVIIEESEFTNNESNNKKNNDKKKENGSSIKKSNNNTIGSKIINIEKENKDKNLKKDLDQYSNGKKNIGMEENKNENEKNAFSVTEDQKCKIDDSIYTTKPLTSRDSIKNKNNNNIDDANKPIIKNEPQKTNFKKINDLNFKIGANKNPTTKNKKNYNITKRNNKSVISSNKSLNNNRNNTINNINFYLAGNKNKIKSSSKTRLKEKIIELNNHKITKNVSVNLNKRIINIINEKKLKQNTDNNIDLLNFTVTNKSISNSENNSNQQINKVHSHKSINPLNVVKNLTKGKNITRNSNTITSNRKNIRSNLIEINNSNILSLTSNTIEIPKCMHDIQNFKKVKLSLGPKNIANTVDFEKNKNKSPSNNKITMNLDIYNINRHHNQNTTLNYCNTQSNKGEEIYDNKNILFNDNINNLYDSSKIIFNNSYRNNNTPIFNPIYNSRNIIDKTKCRIIYESHNNVDTTNEICGTCAPNHNLSYRINTKKIPNFNNSIKLIKPQNLINRSNYLINARSQSNSNNNIIKTSMQTSKKYLYKNISNNSSISNYFKKKNQNLVITGNTSIIISNNKNKNIKTPDANLKPLQNRSITSNHSLLNISNLNSRITAKNFEINLLTNQIINLTKNSNNSFVYFRFLNAKILKINLLTNNTINFENYGFLKGYLTFNMKKYLLNFKPNIRVNGEDFNLELKNIIGLNLENYMKNIIKIHKIFIKYNKNDETLSINKLINLKEIAQIKMERCEKIKAALSHFFSFYIEVDGIESNKLECIFVNFELFDAWYNFLMRVIEKNKIDRANGK